MVHHHVCYPSHCPTYFMGGGPSWERHAGFQKVMQIPVTPLILHDAIANVGSFPSVLWVEHLQSANRTL